MHAALKKELLSTFGLFLVAAGVAIAGSRVHQGLHFDSLGVLNLSERTQDAALDHSVATTSMAVMEVERSLAVTKPDEERQQLRFSEDEYHCQVGLRPCFFEHERQLVQASGGKVKREGARLSITPSDGKPALFVGWQSPPTKVADGDDETHWYLGRLPGNGYHRVEVQFGHDAPGNFLINPVNGKVAFVHNGGDTAAPGPDGRYLVTFNAENPPLSLRVVALDAAGPRIELQCVVGKGDNAVVAQFKGWRDANSFDVVIDVKGKPDQATQVVALRIVRNADSGWKVAGTQTDVLGAIGFACYAPAPLKR